jgi:hypothetical protein
MLKRITTLQVVFAQIAVALASAVLLALVIRFPAVAQRPMPPSGKLLLSLIIVISVGIIGFGGVGMQSNQTRRAGVISSTIVVWLLALYALIFVWINTYGT